MIITKNNSVISNVVVSTAFGHGGDGLFPYTLFPNYQHLLNVARSTNTSILAKSATSQQHIGNVRMLDFKKPSTWLPWLISANKFIKRLPNNGMLNAYGLTNKGIKGESEAIQRGISKGFKIIPNIFPQFGKGEEIAINEVTTAIRTLKSILGDCFNTIEFSYSCPNTKENIYSIMSQGIRCSKTISQLFPNLTQIVKISCLHNYEFAQELAQIENMIIHAINTIPYHMIFPSGISPISNPPGGVSGKPAFQMAYNYNRELRKKVGCPIIMGCGISSADDIDKYFDIGANSVSICTMTIRNPLLDPQKAAKILKKYNS